MGMDDSPTRYSDQTAESKDISAEEAALAIDKVVAIPGMDWDFVNSLTPNAQETFTIRKAFESIIQQRHPSHVKILQIHNKEVNDCERILYSLNYGKSKGEEIVKIGFTYGDAGIYMPDEHIFTRSRLTEGIAGFAVEFAHVLPPLVKICRYNKDKYCLSIHKIQLKDIEPLRESDSKLQIIINTQFAKVLEALK
jgi:hypothetical protein